MPIMAFAAYVPGEAIQAIEALTGPDTEQGCQNMLHLYVLNRSFKPKLSKTDAHEM